MCTNPVKWLSVNKILRIFYLILFLFGMISCFVQIHNVFNYFDVQTNTTKPEKMSGNIRFTKVDNVVFCFAYDSATINVFDIYGKFIYSSKIPKDSKDNYKLYKSDDYFCVGVGMNYETNNPINTDLYRFTSKGFEDKVKYYKLESTGSAELKVDKSVFKSDIFGNLYLELGKHHNVKLLEASIITNYMNNIMYPFFIASVGFILFFAPVFESLGIIIPPKKVYSFYKPQNKK